MTQILLTGIDMPKGDENIHLVISGDGTVSRKIGRVFHVVGKAMEIGPHGKLKDADEIKELIVWGTTTRKTVTLNDVLSFVDEAQTVVPASDKG